MTAQTKTTWREVKLGEVLKIRRGASPRPIHEYIRETGMPWLKIADVTGSGSRFVDSTKEFIKGEGVSKSVVVKTGDLILSNSATPGIPRFMRITACVHDGWLILEPIGDSINKYFLYYRLIIDRKKLISNVTGAIFDNLKTDVLRDHEILLPPINDQKRIADILSAFDDKIELNNKISRTLEEMAQAIFKEWFVKFKFPGYEKVKMVDSELSKIPEGWEVKNLGEIIVLEYGEALTAINRNSGNIPVYGSSGLVGHHDKKLVSGPGIIIGRAGIPGSIYWSQEDFYCVDSTFYVESSISKYFLFYLLKRQNLKSLISGSAVPGINRNMIYLNKIVSPPLDIINDFEKIVSPIFWEIYKNELENQKLAALRDLLLPKLMSGEIGV